MWKTNRPAIGIFLASMSDRYQSFIRDGVIEEARARNINLFCFNGSNINASTGYDHPAIILFEIARRSRLDGIIILSSAVGTFCTPEELAVFFEENKAVPLVSTGYSMPGYSSIAVDNKTGMKKLMTHLIEVHGYKKFLFISGPGKHWESKDRYEAYCSALEQYRIGLQDQLYYEGNFTQSSGNLAIRSIPVDRLKVLDVVVASNDNMAFGAIEELQALGFNVPEDIAVVGFDDAEDCQYSLPQLTTVAQPLERMGRDSVRKIIDVIQSGKEISHELLPSELKIRESCGCLNQFRGKISQLTNHTVLTRGMEDFLDANFLINTVINSRKDLKELLQHVPMMNFLGSAVKNLHQSIEYNDEEFFFNFWQTGLRELNSLRPELVLLNKFTETLISFFNKYYPVPEKLLFIQSLLYQAREYVSGLEDRLRTREYLEYEKIFITLNNISTQLMSTFTEKGLYAVIKDCIERLKIPQFFLYLYEDRTPFPELSRLDYYFINGKCRNIEEESSCFATTDLIPGKLLDCQKSDIFFVQALYVQNEQIGYITLELGPMHGEIYETLRLLISTALHSLALVKRVRDHAQELEKEVARRTADLVRINKELRHQVEQREYAEAALVENEKNLRNLTEAIPVPLFIMEFESTRIIYRNEPFQSFFDPTNKYEFFFSYSQSSRIIQRVLNALKESDMASEIELKLNNGKGVPVWMVATFRRITFNGEDAVIVGLNDISEIKNLQAKLLEVVEAEQRRIGLDLHDDVCQNLAGIGIMATAVSMELKEIDKTLSRKIKDIVELISQTIAGISKISRGLFPADLDSSGLSFALLQIVRQAEKQFNFSCQAEIDEHINIENKEIQLHLFRIGQELIYNAFKHSMASKIVVRLYEKKGQIYLIVKDDGKGFDVNKRITKGMGLRSIMYRAQLIDASLNIIQQPGGGIMAQCIVKGKIDG